MYVRLSRSFGVLDFRTRARRSMPWSRQRAGSSIRRGVGGRSSLQLFRSDAMAPGTHAWCQGAVATNVLFD